MESKNEMLEKIGLVPNAIATREIELTNVMTPSGTKDIKVTVVPFDRRDDNHVKFAFDVSDMMNGLPSPYRTQSEAAQAYVMFFMAHKDEDTKDENSDFMCVIKDLRASRILFMRPEVTKEFNDFFNLA